MAVTRYGPIRYARAARFARPEPVTGGGGPSSGQICPQPPSRLEHVMGPPKTALPQGEDCLNLSIATPARDGRRPVLVFLHGGAFSSGGGLLDWYDGSALAGEADVVVVSVNYRLGVLGYLRLSGVSAPNLGLYDQVEALRWVQNNIAGYGGDPDNVTVFGQSAGALSIALLIDVPEARAMFTRAVLQSGPPPSPDQWPEPTEDVGRLFAEKLGQDPRTASVAALLDAQRATVAARAPAHGFAFPPFRPVTDADPVRSHTGGQGLDVICGWNADDASAFTPTGRAEDAAELTEYLVAAPAREITRRLARAGARVNTYRLDWRPPGSVFGATHCLELPLLLGDEAAWAGSPMLGDSAWPDVDAFGRRLRAVWGRFARTGEVDTDATAGLPIVWNPA